MAEIFTSTGRQRSSEHGGDKDGTDGGAEYSRDEVAAALGVHPDDPEVDEFLAMIAKDPGFAESIRDKVDSIRKDRHARRSRHAPRSRHARTTSRRRPPRSMVPATATLLWARATCLPATDVATNVMTRPEGPGGPARPWATGPHTTARRVTSA